MSGHVINSFCKPYLILHNHYCSIEAIEPLENQDNNRLQSQLSLPLHFALCSGLDLRKTTQVGTSPSLLVHNHVVSIISTKRRLRISTRNKGQPIKVRGSSIGDVFTNFALQVHLVFVETTVGATYGALSDSFCDEDGPYSAVATLLDEWKARYSPLLLSARGLPRPIGTDLPFST